MNGDCVCEDKPQTVIVKDYVLVLDSSDSFGETLYGGVSIELLNFILNGLFRKPSTMCVVGLDALQLHFRISLRIHDWPLLTFLGIRKIKSSTLLEVEATAPLAGISTTRSKLLRVQR